MGKVDCEGKVSEFFKKVNVSETRKLTAVENGTLRGASKAVMSTLLNDKPGNDRSDSQLFDAVLLVEALAGLDSLLAFEEVMLGGRALL